MFCKVPQSSPGILRIAQLLPPLEQPPDRTLQPKDPVLGDQSILLLMVQKSQTTTWDVQNLENNGINYQPQLVHDSFHQQYYTPEV